MQNIMDAKGLALIALGKDLRARGYRFVAVTPATHRRVFGRPPGPPGLQSMFGWNRPFRRRRCRPDLVELLAAAGALQETEAALIGRACGSPPSASCYSRIRAFRTTEPDAVFFGPDTYRFVRLLRSSLAGMPAAKPCRLVDIGCGSGAGGLFAAQTAERHRSRARGHQPHGVGVQCGQRRRSTVVPGARPVFSDVLDGVEGDADLIISNPPYLVDDDRRLYRHGGGETRHCSSPCG